MILKIFFLLLFVTSGFFIIDVNAQNKNTFLIDGYTVTVDNPLVTDIILDWNTLNQLPEGTLTLSEQFTGEILIKIPKEMPRTVNLDFGTGWGLFYPNGEMNQNIKESDSTCFYFLELKLEDTDFVEFLTVSVSTGRWESVSIMNQSCGDFTLKQQIQNNMVANEIECNNNKHVLAERNNGKLSCVYQGTAEKFNWVIL